MLKAKYTPDSMKLLVLLSGGYRMIRSLEN
jgi:hypothetical protein